MSEFKFTCPECGMRLSAVDDWRGEKTDCPNCGNEITIPVIDSQDNVSFSEKEIGSDQKNISHEDCRAPKQSTETIVFICPECGSAKLLDKSLINTKITCDACAETVIVKETTERPCPYCKEKVKVDAVRCKYCKMEIGNFKEFLNSPIATPQKACQFSKNLPTDTTSLWQHFVNGITIKVFDFRGRANRKEYWSIFLFFFIISFFLGFVGGVLDAFHIGASNNAAIVIHYLSMATILPNISLIVRRFHDIGISGRFFGWYFAVVYALGDLVLFFPEERVLTIFSLCLTAINFGFTIVIGLIPGSLSENKYDSAAK